MNAPVVDNGLLFGPARYAGDNLDQFIDAVMRNEDKQYPLMDVLEGELELGVELARIFKAPRQEQQLLLDDLEAKCRRVVEKFVRKWCMDKAQEASEDAYQDRRMERGR